MPGKYHKIYKQEKFTSKKIFLSIAVEKWREFDCIKVTKLLFFNYYFHLCKVIELEHLTSPQFYRKGAF